MTRETFTPEIYSQIQETTNKLKHLGIIEDAIDVSLRGEMNIALASESPEPVIVKMPRDDNYHRSEFEALMICALAEGDPGPLEIPHYIDSSIYPPYVALTRVPGTALDIVETLSLAPEQRNAIGSKIGTFAAWMASALPPEHFSTICDETNHRAYNRLEVLYFHRHAAKYCSTFPTPITQILFDTTRRYEEYEKAGLLFANGVITGHADLRPDNLTFTENKDGSYDLTGVFDFGAAKLTTPEEELRHVWALGESAVHHAAKAYGDETGQTPDMELIHLYAAIQAVATFCNCSQRGIEYIALTSLLSLRTLYPDLDWSRD